MDDEPRQHRTRWFFARGALGASISVVANLAVLRTGRAVTELPPPYRLDAPGPVVVPVAAAIGATALYSALERRSSRPFDAFARLASVGLVVSFVPIAATVLSYETSWSGVVVLVAMHVAVTTALVAAFSPCPRRR